jgi:hypothetical protein
MNKQNREIKKLVKDEVHSQRRLKILEAIILQESERSIETLKSVKIEHHKLTEYLLRQVLAKKKDFFIK